MSNRNRTAGNNWERLCVNTLKKVFKDIVSSRSESKSRDDQGVDLINKDEYKNGKVPFNFQCKSTASKADYHTLLTTMPDDVPPVILHQYKRKSNTKFMTQGEYVIMKYNDFIDLLKKTYG